VSSALLCEAAVTGQQVRREVHYSGNVQGVGFRYSTCSVAAHYSVTGYVKNLADGRVELVVEGDDAELDALLAEIRGRLDRYIRSVEIQGASATGDFPDFRVAY
jgi:acylphosphatase